MKRFLFLVLILSATELFSQAKKSPADYGRELTVAQLPTNKTQPLSVDMAFACGNLSVLADPKLGKEDLSQVSPDVLSRLPKASQICLSDASVNLPTNQGLLIATFTGIWVDAQAEKDRREYNEVVGKYNELRDRYLALVKVAATQRAMQIPTPQPITPRPLNCMSTDYGDGMIGTHCD